MAIIEGTGIVAAGKEARAKALAKSKQVTSDKKIAAEYKVDPIDRMIRDIEKNSQRIRSQESTGAVKETGRGMGDRFNPFTDRVDASDQIKKPSFFSPGGGAFDERNNVKVATTDLSGLTSDEQTTSTFGTSFTEQASANLADASIYQKKEDGIYRPSDNIYDSLKEITRPKIEEQKPYLDSSGDFYDKKPYTETDAGAKYYSGTDAKIIQRKGDDMRFSQPYNRDDKGQLTKNYQKEYSSYLQSGESLFGGLSKVQADQVATGETPRTTGEKLSSFFLNKDKYMPKSTEMSTRMLTKPEFEQYRRDLVKTAAEKSIYGADVEVGSKRFVEGTGFDQYVRNPDFTYTKTGEKINQLQDTNIPKGEGYFFKDFYKPGEFRTKEDLNRYLTDRGAYMTDMPSNFKGGISGRGEKSDDLTSMYKSTAGDLKKENEKKEPSTLQKVGNFLGNVTNTVLGIQPAGASQIGGPLPSGTQTPTTSRSTAAPKQTVASLPSNYKQTESEAFRKAAAFKEAQGIAKRNPNVSVGVDSKGQPTATATNDSGVARAQAAAVNRKLQGKTISQVKAENKKSMQDAARKRNEAFKKSRAQKKKSSGGFGKSTPTKKKSAPKKSAPKKKAAPSTNKRAQAAAKRRASQAKAKAAKKSKSKSSKSKSSKSKSSKSSGPGSSRGKAAAKGRTRRGRRGRRCDIFLKYNISPLTNMNLIRDDLAEVAYFVKEIQK